MTVTVRGRRVTPAVGDNVVSYYDDDGVPQCSERHARWPARASGRLTVQVRQSLSGPVPNHHDDGPSPTRSTVPGPARASGQLGGRARVSLHDTGPIRVGRGEPDNIGFTQIDVHFRVSTLSPVTFKFCPPPAALTRD